MELLSAEVPRTHEVVFAGDGHIGTLACYEKGLAKLVSYVRADSKRRLAWLGDAIEAISTDDPRFSAEVHDGKLTPMAQAEAFADLIAPIRKQVICVLAGNHELRLSRYGDLTKYICDRAQVPYGAYSAKVAMKHGGKLLYKIYLTHGRWSVNSIADDPVRRLSNVRLSIKRKLAPLAGDCAIMGCGHTHKLLTLDPEHDLYMTDNGNHLFAAYTKGVQNAAYIPPNARWYFNSGSFLKNAVVGATTYSEAAGYAPLQMGWCQAHVVDGTITALTETRIG